MHTSMDTAVDSNDDRRMSMLTDAPVSFGTIPREHWVQPEWIDEEKAHEARRRMGMDRINLVPYGGAQRYSKYSTPSSTSDIHHIIGSLE